MKIGKLIPKYHRCEERVGHIVTDVSDKTVKNWIRMQNAADLGVFYKCEECACMLYEI